MPVVKVEPAGWSATRCVDIAQFPSGRLIVLNADNKVWQSTDGGDTWAEHAEASAVGAVRMTGAHADNSIVLHTTNRLFSAESYQYYRLLTEVAGELNLSSRLSYFISSRVQNFRSTILRRTAAGVNAVF